MRYCIDCDADISPLRSNAKRCPECAYRHRQKRAHGEANRYREPSLTQKLASMILLHLKIPHETAQLMKIDEILKLVEWDHYPVARNTALSLKWESHQTNHPSNLQPLTKADHRVKTSTVDVPQAAKGKRLTKKQEEHRARMLAPDQVESKPRSRWPKRKMPSRPFPTKPAENSSKRK